VGVAEFDFPERDRQTDKQRQRERQRDRETESIPWTLLNMAVVGGGGDRRFLTDDEG
jgi:hypothetical protein